MKKKLLFLLFFLAFVSPIFAQYTPTAENLAARKQFADDRFGIFIHWGIYSMLANGEWVQNNRNINYKEYTHLADGFCPSRFDADAWVRLFKEAGARYITITSRHHDGFSMFHTAQDTFNIVDATPFHRDVLKELAQACERHGLSLHFYYSHLDWHRLDYPLGRTGRRVGRPTDQQNWQSYYDFMNAQLRELLTNYGTIRCLWFDGVWDHESDAQPFDWHLPEQYRMIHSLQPACLIGNNHHRKLIDGEDIQIFEQDLPGENTAGFSGQQTISQLPLETCMTMNNTWGYDITDKNYKNTDEIVKNLVRAAGKNGNLLLNVGPRPDGEIPAEAVERLREVGAWLKVNGETIYGTRGGIVAPHDWGVTTQRDKTLYVHILNLQDDGLFLPISGKKVKKAVMFNTRKPVSLHKSANGVTILLPEHPKAVDTIVEITLN